MSILSTTDLIFVIYKHAEAQTGNLMQRWSLRKKDMGNDLPAGTQNILSDIH